MGSKINTILAFIVAVAFMTILAFYFNPLTQPYLINFLLGASEIILIFVYQKLIKNILNSTARQKIRYYSIQIILAPFFIIPNIIAFIVHAPNSRVISIMAYTTGMFVASSLWAMSVIIKKHLA